MNDLHQSESAEPVTATLTKVVGAADTAASFGEHFPQAAATPWVLGLAEVACHMSVANLLSEGQVTVGTKAAIEHLAPTPIGASVTATATLTSRTGRRLAFEVTVHDGIEECARVEHHRAIVDAKSIADRLHAKSSF